MIYERFRWNISLINSMAHHYIIVVILYGGDNMRTKIIANISYLTVIVSMVLALSPQSIKATTGDEIIGKNMGVSSYVNRVVLAYSALGESTKEDSSTKAISIYGHVNSKDWANLSNFKALQSLSLIDVNQNLFKKTEHREAFLSVLETLQIVDLDLSGKLILDADLKRLPKTLVSLSLSRTPISGSGLAYLKERCPNLSRLDVSCTVVGKKSVLNLSPLKLDYLSVKETGIQIAEELSSLGVKVLVVK